MKTSEKGLKLIKEFEGLRLEPYKCDAGVWTIGYGYTKDINQNTKPITNEQAEDFLKDDLKFFEGLSIIKNMFLNKSIKINLALSSHLPLIWEEET